MCRHGWRVRNPLADRAQKRVVVLRQAATVPDEVGAGEPAVAPTVLGVAGDAVRPVHDLPRNRIAWQRVITLVLGPSERTGTPHR